MPTVNTTRDFIVVDRLKAHNAPLGVIDEATDQRTVKTTMIILVRSRDHIVATPVGLHDKFPYNNHNRRLPKQYVWWKYLGENTIVKTRHMVAKFMDVIAAKIYSGEPIVAIRVVLFDWATGEPMPFSLTQDFWYFTSGFDDSEIDDMTLRNWGIPINAMREEDDSDVLPDTNPDADKQNDDAPFKGLLDEATNLGIAKAITEMPKVLEKNNKPVTPLDLRRLTLSLRSEDSRKRLRNFLVNKYETDQLWRATIKRSYMKNHLVHASWEWCWREIRRLLRTV